MNRIVMIRHGLTQSNVEKRSQGWLDPPLNEEGQRQAALLGEHVRRRYNFSRVISSDLTRCTMTADALGFEYTTDERLREFNSGVFGGLLFTDIEVQYREEMIGWKQGYGSGLGGESRLELAARVGRFIEKSGILDIDGDVCLVTHGGTIRALLSVFLQLDVNSTVHFSQHNTGVTIVSRTTVNGEPSFRLEMMNSTEHLRG